MTDHAPIDLAFAFGEAQEKSKGWQMNTSILQSETSCMDLRTHINIFFETDNRAASQANVRDAFKAYIRGILIQQTALIKKQDDLKISNYEEDLKWLEKEYWENPNEACLASLVKAVFLKLWGAPHQWGAEA